MRLPPDAEQTARHPDPSQDPNAASPRPDVAPCLEGCGANGAPARAAAQGGRAGAENPGIDSARTPGCNDTAAREGEVVGYWRAHSTLTHVVIRNAGHMVPHDRPLVAQARTCLLCHYPVSAHVVIRNAGHMVPHDRPLVAQARTCLLCHYPVSQHMW